MGDSPKGSAMILSISEALCGDLEMSFFSSSGDIPYFAMPILSQNDRNAT
jgi:hypothetical protein